MLYSKSLARLFKNNTVTVEETINGRIYSIQYVHAYIVA